LDVVVAQPCFVVTPACFVEPSKFKPEFVVLRPVGEQVSGQLDEEVLVVLAQAFQPSTEDDGGTRVAEVETSATRCEVVHVGPKVNLNVRPPPGGVERVDQQCGFQQFLCNVDEVHAPKLACAFRVPPKHREEVLQHGVNAGPVVEHHLQSDQHAPRILLREIVEQGLPCVLFSPRHVLVGTFGVALGEVQESAGLCKVPAAEVAAWVLQGVAEVLGHAITLGIGRW